MGKTHRENLRERLINGRYESYKGLSICLINRFIKMDFRGIKYQVHSDGRIKFSELYSDIEEAISKYFEIRRKLR
jgi:hypothetical protein